MDPASLKSEILNDAALAEALNAGSLSIVVAAFAGAHASATVRGPLTRQRVLSKLVDLGKLDGILTADSATARQLRWFLSHPDYAEIDFSAGSVSTLIAAAVVEGLVTSQDVSAVLALATRPATRAEAVWGAGAVVTLADVIATRSI